jgi:AcrR family transcriptional regulator
MSVRPTRRRGATLEKAILDAAWDELAERGWGRFSIEGVAVRAGTAKTVLYRRWDNRVQLAQQVLQRANRMYMSDSAAGAGLREDLLQFVRDMSELLRGPFGEAVRGVISEGDPSTQSSLFAGSVVVTRVDEIIGRARARGDLPGDPDPLTANLGHAIVMSEFLHTASPPPDEGLVALVDKVWLPALIGSARPGTA